MSQFKMDQAKDYPRVIFSEDKKYELKTEYEQGWGGYILKHYWKASKSTTWITKKDAYFMMDLADGDSHGYQRVRWKGHNLLFTPYSNWDDIVERDVFYDVKANSETIREKPEEPVG